MLTEAHALAPADAKILYALAHVEVDEQKTAAGSSRTCELIWKPCQTTPPHTMDWATFYICCQNMTRPVVNWSYP